MEIYYLCLHNFYFATVETVLFDAILLSEYLSLSLKVVYSNVFLNFDY